MKLLGSTIGIALVLVYAVGSGMLVNTRDGWFSELNKPSWQPPAYVPGLIWPYCFVVLGIAAVVGHIFPIWANFKGGKGIATLFGMILAIQPMVAGSLVIVFFLMLFLTRYVSLSSITASIAFPVLIFFIFREPEIMYRLFALATAILVVLTHHKNINRLLSGNESQINLFKKKDQE